MSIATLKRKTNSGGNPRNDPISGVGNKGFALNGTLRNIGSVGQFRMVSNVTRTRYRGNTPIGWGGSGGAYPVYVFNSGDCCTNDANIIKKSTKNTAAMIDERFKGILFGTYPNTWVKDDDNSYRITKTQGQYVGAVTNKVGSCNFSKPLCCNTDNTCTCTRGKFIYIGTKKKIFYNPTTKNVANFSPYGEMMSQGVYITAGGLAKNKNLPTPSCMQHYPPMLSHKGCDTNVITWQEAKAVGIMPPDYMDCILNPLGHPCDVNKCDILCLNKDLTYLNITNSTYSVSYVDSSNNIIPEPRVNGFTIYRVTSTLEGATYTTNNVTMPVSFLIIGGGGSGAGSGGASILSGGGGAGGFIESSGTINPNTTYSIYVGKGGFLLNSTANGENSLLQLSSGTLSAVGGGGGGNLSTNLNGLAGGSGGGGAYNLNTNSVGTGGNGVSGQGFLGASGLSNSGGGAGGNGISSSITGGPGPGLPSTITGQSVYYAGGGGGGSYVGGIGGGGGGGTTGTNGFGGGGGGGSISGRRGGDGIVILRIPSYI
jgi:hypothetical protein